jgi:hypothetical protein
MPRQPADDPHTSAAANHRLYREAAALLRELEVAADGAEGMALAQNFVAVMTAHIGPLRKALSDVAFYTEAEKVFGLHVIGSLDGVTGKAS